MKEVTEWDNNPREMWVWDNNPETRIRSFVVYVGYSENVEYGVVTWNHLRGTRVYKCCAEIEEQRRMTNKQLARWLAEKPDRECKYGDHLHAHVSHFFHYPVDEENGEVKTDYYVREGDEPWHIPLAEEV